MGAQKTMKEHQLVINHFNNGKYLREIAEIIQRSQFTLQHIVERYKKSNRLTSKVRKSAKKIFTACAKDEF
jgi:transposase